MNEWKGQIENTQSKTRNQSFMIKTYGMKILHCRSKILMEIKKKSEVA